MVGTGILVTSGTNLTELPKMQIENYHCHLEVLCGCSHIIHTGLIDYEVIIFMSCFPV